MRVTGRSLRAGAAVVVALALAVVVAVLAGEDAPDARQIAADALGVPASDIRVTQIDEEAGGRELRAQMEVAGRDGPERVLVQYSAEDGSLLRILWIDRFPDAGDGVRITQDAALQRALALRARLLSAVPVELELTERRLDDQIPQYMFGWQARVAPDTFSGDHVLISISAVTGEPVAYLQDVARVRPSLDEIRISRNRAIELAAQAAERVWRDEFDRAVTVETTKARLILSSVISSSYGPVWLIDHEVNDAATGSRLELTERAIDAMSGEVLR